MPVRKDSRGRWMFRHVVELPLDASGKSQKKRIYGTAPRHCNTKAAAKQAMYDAIKRAQSEAQQPARNKKEVPTFKQFVEERFMPYTKNRNKHTEYRGKCSCLESHLFPAFGDWRLDAIGTMHIEDYKREKLERGRVHKRAKSSPRGLAKKTIDNHLIVLRRILNVAKDWEIIDRVPKFELFRPAPPPFDFLDFEEAERLIEAAQTIPGHDPRDHFAVGDGDWGRLVLVAIKTGMRIGELTALRQHNVHFQAGVIHVCEAITDGVMDLPKSGKPRDIPMSKAVKNALLAQRHDRGEYVFSTLEGHYLTDSRGQKPLDLACKRAGLRRVTWHVLRHTFASHLAMRGVPLKAIQELLGHAGMEQTMRYAHLTQSTKQNAVDLLDEPPPTAKTEPQTEWQHDGSNPEKEADKKQPEEGPVDD